MDRSERIHLELTTEQRKAVKEASGQDVTALEFKAEELEQRIAPSDFSLLTVSKFTDKASP